MSIEAAAQWFKVLQLAICKALEAVDGEARFVEDAWDRPGGGGGLTRVLSGGAVIEKGGVNWSDVHGEMDPAFAPQVPGSGTRFRATGLSIVIHPQSPMVPAVHMNVRMVQKGETSWVGGGLDLTPVYAREEDAVHFHGVLGAACDRFDPSWYPRFKAWCDEYFFLPHRGETRGIGGVFFDYVGAPSASLPASVRKSSPRALPDDVPLPRALAFAEEIGSRFLEAYVPIVEARRREPWGDAERQYQLYRRGRYAEFNLLYDRGTHFGLQTGGRTESILMSLPPLVRWTYAFQPAPGTREAALLEFLKPRDWRKPR